MDGTRAKKKIEIKEEKFNILCELFFSQHKCFAM